MYNIVFGGFSLAGEGGASLKALERSRVEENKAWINHR